MTLSDYTRPCRRAGPRDCPMCGGEVLPAGRMLLGARVERCLRCGASGLAHPVEDGTASLDHDDWRGRAALRLVRGREW